MIDAKWRKQPGTIGHTDLFTFKGYRVGCCSFGMLYARRDFEGFGEVFRYVCDHCGERFNEEPRAVCTQRETWGHWGGTPAEYEWACPSCDGLETVYENEDPDLSFKANRRYRIPRRRSA